MAQRGHSSGARRFLLAQTRPCPVHVDARTGPTGSRDGYDASRTYYESATTALAPRADPGTDVHQGNEREHRTDGDELRTGHVQAGKDQGAEKHDEGDRDALEQPPPVRSLALGELL